MWFKKYPLSLYVCVYTYVYIYTYTCKYIYIHKVNNLRIFGHPDIFEQGNMLQMIISSSYLFSQHLLDSNCMPNNALSSALSFNSQKSMIYSVDVIITFTL